MAATVHPNAAADVVALRIRGRCWTAPATVRITVVVEPNAANRTLRVEMDGDRLFRASVLTLEGAEDKRLHEIQFAGVPSGQYSIQATVLSAHDARGTAMEHVAVVGSSSEC